LRDPVISHGITWLPGAEPRWWRHACRSMDNVYNYISTRRKQSPGDCNTWGLFHSGVKISSVLFGW